MRVLLTFDVEVWCNDWSTLDADFPASFERYVFGRSPRGDYALPKTLEVLDRYGLKGVFFVEPLFAARFGIEHLATIVNLIHAAGQEIQLHIHPEWSDETTPPLLPGANYKRQMLTEYSAEEQKNLITTGLDLLKQAGGGRPNAFRAGSFSCNADTFQAVAQNGLAFDSSINPEMQSSRPGKVLDPRAGYCEPFRLGALNLVPMSSFRDGFGRPRHAQIGACSAEELIQALRGANELGWRSFVLLSHNFELMVPDKPDPDAVVVRRFEALCRFLGDNRDTLPTAGFRDLPPIPDPLGLELPRVNRIATIRRYMEQGFRRLAQ